MNLDDPHLFKPRSASWENAPQVAAVPTYPPLSRLFKAYVILIILAGLGLLAYGVTGILSATTPHPAPSVTPYPTPDPTP